MGSFRDLELRIAYTSADDPLHTFYIPVLSCSVRYDRAAGFFSSGALVVAAQGLAHLIRAGGTMRLLVGAQLSEDDVEAIRRGEARLEEVTTERLVELLTEPEDELARRRLEALAWMVAAGTLQVRVVLPRGPDGHPLAAKDTEAYFHVKWGIFTDRSGDRIAFSGSINETAAAWRWHYEDIMVFRSWAPGDGPRHVERLARHFETLWGNRAPDWIALPVPEAVRERLLSFRPAEPPECDPLERSIATLPSPAAFPKEAVAAAFLRDAPYFLGIGERLGRATAAIRPWPHQLRIAEDVVSTFPQRYLLADEVGLGKTIEAGLVLRDLVVSGVVKRALVLAPASVLRQWQEELREKLALEVEIFDGAQFVGPPPDRVERRPRTLNPFDDASVLLCSSQLVKRKDRRRQLLEASNWDLVIVDEAHHARRKDFQDLSVRRPNRLLELLEGADGLPGLASKTRGLLLLTATPMQVHPVEVWDLLVQLGLAGRWGASERNFLRYFRELELASASPEDADWAFLARMAQDELQQGGPIDPDVERALQNRLGFAGWARVRAFLEATDPQSAIAKMAPEERDALLAVLRHLTPLRRRMFRHTRNLLRRYQERGLLPGKVPGRDPEPRWIQMTDEEAELYHRVEEYISRFYGKYEQERKGLGFVMTVYRRRLTSSFVALGRSLERRLDYLRGLRLDLGLTDEDTEDLELSEDISEQLEGEAGQRLHRVQQEEIRYVEDFLARIRDLPGDSKFEQLMKDLERALSQREQVVVFTQYTDTMDYLKERLRPVYGRRIACYSGRGGEWWDGVSWSHASKEDIKNAFKAGEVQILLGTDALAEGLNLQTCGVEINYDAPWNPMRLEQRIGRIDRIGQQHDRVWIWTYFYNGTVEAEVYRRLWQRIGWFEGVIGRLQPILHRVERTIRDLALTDPEERGRAMPRTLADLEEEIERVRAEGLDLDAYIEQAVDAPPEPKPPATLEELERFLTGSALVGHRFRAHPEIDRAYLVRVRGEEVGATFDPAVADAHPESVRLLTFGDRVLDELLADAAKETPATGKLLRVATEDLPRRFVAWYGIRDGQLLRIERFTDLLACLEGPAPAWGEWKAEAQKDFATAVMQRLEAERAALRQRAEERLSALQERGREILARATYVWTARTRYGGAGVGEINEVTLRSMIHCEGYPYGALARLVSELPEISSENQEWREIEQKTLQQLEALWQWIRTEASQLVEELCKAQEHLATLKTSPRPPRVTVAAR